MSGRARNRYRSKEGTRASARCRRTAHDSCHRSSLFVGRALPVGPVRESDFSIYRSDIVDYGPELRRYFLREFARLLIIDEDCWRNEREGNTPRACEDAYEAVPFWGKIYRANAGWLDWIDAGVAR
jgi:hypothetical protein